MTTVVAFFISASDLPEIATAAGVTLAAVALFQQKAQARTAFEDQIVRQYREIIKPDLIIDVLIDGAIAEVSESEKQRHRSLYLYFDLCNEQIYLRALGRVRRTTWIQWRDGIRSNLAQEEIGSSWELIKQTTGDFTELRRVESEGFADPRRWEPRWRRPLVRLGLSEPLKR